ncbi:2-amino-4-hydroxy-6-hydroxymethyldihydropteridine diphosphokinase [Desulforhopalus singaporensis]|nr:2-amino-4-hydroxy-6-hydroxymethyldihydropteridine diphosphokinase [Desulforhopalus singaporensis]
MTRVYIALGSNLGDSKRILTEAWATLGECERITLDGLSSPYLSAPVGMKSQHWFTNAVGRLHTDLEPLELLEVLLETEARFGRIRKSGSFGYQDRSLDLDLLYYGNVIMDVPELILPHPRIGERLFVLVPLRELDSELVDYATGKSVGEMQAALEHAMEVSGGKPQEIICDSWEPAHLEILS